jgi:hypothetical protein
LVYPARWPQRHAPTAEARGAVLTALVNLDPARRLDTTGTGPVQTVAFSPDGKLLVAASRDGFARVWAVGEPPSLAAPPIAVVRHPDQVRSAVFDPAGGLLATSGADGTVRLWTLADLAAPAAEFGGDRREILTVAFNRTGRLLATTGLDGTVTMWNVSDHAHPVKLWADNRNIGVVRAVAFRPDNRLLAAGNDDSTVSLWNIDNPSKPRALPSVGGFSGGVAGVAFDPTGRILAAATLDNSARLWDVSDPQHAAALASPLAGDADTSTGWRFIPTATPWSRPATGRPCGSGRLTPIVPAAESARWPLLRSLASSGPDTYRAPVTRHRASSGRLTRRQTPPC